MSASVTVLCLSTFFRSFLPITPGAEDELLPDFQTTPAAFEGEYNAGDHMDHFGHQQYGDVVMMDGEEPQELDVYDLRQIVQDADAEDEGLTGEEKWWNELDPDDHDEHLHVSKKIMMKIF